MKVNHTFLEKSFAWAYLGYTDIIMRYRRTVLGPLWLVLATAITVSGMAFVNSALFNSPLGDSFLYVSSGMIVWMFLSSLTIESANIFIYHAAILGNLNVKHELVCIRSFVRSLIIFLHNLVFYIIIYFIFDGSVRLWHFLFPVWMLVFFITFMGLCHTIGILCCRFRDVPQIIASIVSISVFITPILWKVNALGDKALLIYLNPFVHYLDVVRSSLLGQAPDIINVKVIFIITIFINFISIYTARKYSKRVRFWL